MCVLTILCFYRLLLVSGTMAMATSTEYGGYEYAFVKTLHSRCICNICQYPSRDAYMTGQCCQGQTICKSCLDHWQAKRRNICPVCRKEGSTVTYPNYPVDREVRSSHVYCTNKQRGCCWQGEVNDITNHLKSSNGCQFVEVTCSNVCGKVIQRRHVTNHLRNECPYRNVRCQYCFVTGKHQFIYGLHKKVCSKFPLPCPNRCEVGSVPREDMEKHKAECQLAEVYCSNCKRKVERRHLIHHVEAECPRRKVTCQYCHVAGEHRFIDGQHKEVCLKFPLLCPNHCEVGSIPRENMEKHKGECQLEIVSCSNNCGEVFKRRYMINHVMNECLHRTVYCWYCHGMGEHQFIEGHHKKECPRLPLTCPNQCGAESVPREDMEAHRRECPFEMIQCEYHSVGCEVKIARKDRVEHKKEGIEDHLMMTVKKLTTSEKQLADTKLQLNDTTQDLAIAKVQLAEALQRISKLETLMSLAADNEIASPATSAAVLEPKWCNKLASLSEVGDQQVCCPAFLKMPSFNEKKNTRSEWYSEPFYTHSNGYRMCLCVFAAGYGDGKGTHLSVSLYLMKGLYDSELTWPLRGKFKIKLLNQISDSEHHSKILTYNDKTPDDNAGRVIEGEKADGWGFHRFISNEDLHKTTKFRETNTTCQYLKDDCIFFKVTILN